jgi:hypothetical protein
VEGSCGHGNELSGSIKCWEAAQLAACQEGLSSMSECCCKMLYYLKKIVC